MSGMKERVSVSLEPEALKAVRAEVETGRASSLSAAIEQALRRYNKTQALREALELSDATHGPITEEARAWGRKEMERAFREMSSSMPES
jgi:Arc/MetJ-type ribon-helix-helix transcriptional regulator